MKVFLVFALFTLLSLAASTRAQAPARPNILWISAEDLSPDLGCYGDSYAKTPNLDRLASEGALFRQAFATAPACSPSQSSVITGMYAPSIGTQHMRSMMVLPTFVKCFTEYLRDAGYYCTNNSSRTDYNFRPPKTAWDENGLRAHWKNRGADQPFFAAVNIFATHESRIREDSDDLGRLFAPLKGAVQHDPGQAKLPPYYPDTPAIRHDWAMYHDLISVVDVRVGALLKELEDAGLAQNTVVIFTSDNGRGLPRAKRWAYDAGVHVPLIVRWPGKIQPGSVREDLVSLIDLAPTMLSIAGVEAPKHFQGQAFLGDSAAPPREYIYVHRDRMEEAPDMIRAVRAQRYKLIRNFRPELPYAQSIRYTDAMPTMQEWRRLNDEGKLVGPQKLFFAAAKPEFELYDLQEDPHEINNLADRPEQHERLNALKAELERWMNEIGDTGLIPEVELQAHIDARTTTPVGTN